MKTSSRIAALLLVGTALVGGVATAQVGTDATGARTEAGDDRDMGWLGLLGLIGLAGLTRRRHNDDARDPRTGAVR